MGQNCTFFHFNTTVGLTSDWSVNVTFGLIVRETSSLEFELATSNNTNCVIQNYSSRKGFSLASIKCFCDAPSINVNTYEYSFFADACASSSPVFYKHEAPRRPTHTTSWSAKTNRKTEF